MRNKITLLTVIIISITSIYAKDIKGTVSDSRSLPLKNVSVHIKNVPLPRVFTDEKGKFEIEIENIASFKEYVLVFSHLGYETREYSIKKDSYRINHEVALTESSIVLDDVIVRKKLSRKQRKARNISLLERFKKQVEKDFELRNRTYKAFSEIEAERDGEIVFSNNLIAECKEMVGARVNKSDSTAYTYTDIKNYIDNGIESGIQQMSHKFVDNKVVSKKRRDNKMMLDSTFYNSFLDDSVMRQQTLYIHEASLRTNRNLKFVIKKQIEDPKEWEIVEGVEQTILRHRQKFGVLGIIKYLTVTDYIVDSHTYSIHRIFQELSAEVNIPFGYKIPQDVVMLLNVISSTDKEMTKYRVRHVHIDTTFDTIYDMLEACKYPTKKIAHLNISLTDTKERNIKIEAKGAVKVLSIEHND